MEIGMSTLDRKIYLMLIEEFINMKINSTIHNNLMTPVKPINVSNVYVALDEKSSFHFLQDTRIAPRE